MQEDLVPRHENFAIAGPHRMSEGTSLASSSERSSVSGPTARPCPTKSCSASGRMVSASGFPSSPPRLGLFAFLSLQAPWLRS